MKRLSLLQKFFHHDQSGLRGRRFLFGFGLGIFVVVLFYSLAVLITRPMIRQDMIDQFYVRDDAAIKFDTRGHAHIQGDAAPVVLTTYLDYECSFCGSYFALLREIVAAYPGRVQWRFRHFPMHLIHPNARNAALTAECIGEEFGEEAFWNFSERLFKLSSSLEPAIIDRMAEDAGLTAEMRQGCSERKSAESEVDNHYQEGLLNGVRGVPSTFVNDRLIPGALSRDDLERRIQEYQ